MIEVKCYKCGLSRDVEVELKDVDFSPVQWWVAVYKGRHSGEEDVTQRFQATTLEVAQARAERDAHPDYRVASLSLEMWRNPHAEG